MNRKILFIGDGFPLETNAGSVLYQRIMKVYGIDNFCYYGIGNKSNLEWPIEFTNLPKQQSSLRLWPMIRGVKYLKKIPLLEELYYFLLIPIIANKVRKFAKQNNVDIIFAVLRADVLAIINKLNKNIIILGYISDTVEAEISDKNLIYKYKVKEYELAINSSHGIYVAGETMKNYIEEKYDKITSVLRLGYEKNSISYRKIKDTIKEVKIFFGGSVYAFEELELFIKALDILACKYEDYTLILTIASTYKVKSNHKRIMIKNLGWIEEKELIKIMHNSHFGYIPYKFDENYKMQMTYAFPSKAGFYLSTGLPIFFHGPKYSSMATFFEKYSCGIHCDSLHIEDIVNKIEKLIFDPTYYQKCVVAANQAFDNEFSMDIMVENFRKLLNINLANAK
jgi:glycosyltransferase involved in cell wall biosynthesis